MGYDYREQANPGVQKISPYVPGKSEDELQRELGLSKIIKLASNENPLGPSESALKAIRKKLNSIARYPDGNGFELKNVLAKKLDVELDQITLGNGSNDVLELLAKAFCSSGSEVIFSQYAFAVYPLATLAAGATPVVVPAKEWGHDLEAMLSAITPNTQIIFIANPNNPTGTWITRAALDAFLEKVPANVLVVLDEAYFEYVSQTEYPNGIECMSEYSNLVITRTFSKAYGLAGLRVGYSVSDPSIADILNRVRQPFNVDLLAQTAAVAALGDDGFLQRSVALNQRGMAQVTHGFSALGLSWIPSVGNFVCVHVGSKAAEIYQSMLRKGVIVRPVSNYDMPEYLRVSIGLEEENQVMLGSLGQALSEV